MIDWIVVNKGDIRARGLADRHYSRQTKYAPQFTRPGNNLVLLSQDCSALWVTWKPADGIKRMDGFDGYYECTIFRREGEGLASEMIKAAIEKTEGIWGKPQGWITYIGDVDVKSPNKGYCFKRAGFRLIGRNKKGNLSRLTLKYEQGVLG